jgi:hypothetical protein
MSALEPIASPANPGPGPGQSTEAERSADVGNIHAEVRVLPNAFRAAKEPDASKASPEHPSCSCPTSGRNLVVCIDGTANQFSEKVSTFYLSSRRRALTLYRTRMSSSSTVASSKTRRNSRTIIVGLAPTLESPRLLFTIGNKLLIMPWIWPLHGTHNIQLPFDTCLTAAL